MSLPDDFFSSMAIPLISLGGVAAGVLLSYIAQEELAAGKKYFITMYRVIFVLLSSMAVYLLYLVSFNVSIIFFFLAMVLFMTDLKKPSYAFPYAFYAHYFFFLAGYFLSGKQSIVAATIFLYGLPIGTLLRVKD